MIDFRNCDWMENGLPNKSQHLIIADPPYFEVKGKFDYIWESFDEYLEDVKEWAEECKRLLTDNGTLFWWGHAKKIAYSQIILDNYFNLENSLVWEKRECKTRSTCFEESRVFAPVTERVLMYSNETEPNQYSKTGLEMIYSDPDCFKTIKAYMRIEREKVIYKNGFKNIAEFDDYICEVTNTKSVVKRHYFADSQYTFPTPDIYKLLQTTGFFKKEYEELRLEYEELRRPFNNYLKLTDVLKFSQESHKTKDWNHPTMKPQTLTSALIQTCSRKGMNILVPFAGSGTEIVEGVKCVLNVTAFELDKDYYEAAQKRIKEETAQLSFLNEI